MVGSILSLAFSLAVLVLAALVIGLEIRGRWALIATVLNHRDPGDVRMHQSPLAVWQSAA